MASNNNVNNSSGLLNDREFLMKVLRECIAFLQTSECKDGLKRVAPDENRIDDYVTSKQKEIFSKHGLDPEKAYKDKAVLIIFIIFVFFFFIHSYVAKISSVFKEDREVMQHLIVLSSTEEVITSQAIQNRFEDMNDTEVPSFAEFQNASVSNLTQQQLGELQSKMQQQLNNMTPQQRMLFMQKLLAQQTQSQQHQQQQQTHQQHTHSNNNSKMEDDDDAPPPLISPSSNNNSNNSRSGGPARPMARDLMKKD